MESKRGMMKTTQNIIIDKNNRARDDRKKKA